MEIGKAKYSSGKTVFKIQDGDNVFRILPPLGKLAKSGKWNMYYRVEWGYKNSAGKNRPFQDVRVVNYDTKMVEVESAAHLRREALKTQKNELTAALRNDPTNSELRHMVNSVTEDIKRYNLDAKYYLNVIDLQGKIGLLKIGSRAFKALKVEIDKLRKQGVDPLSVDNGRFFNFNRSNSTGNFQDTAYQVTVYKERVEVGGETYEKDKAHKVDKSVIDRLSDEAFELSNMYPEVTASQVEQMVNGGSAAVDRILGAGDVYAHSDDEVVLEEEEGETMVSTTPIATTPPVVSAPTAVAPLTKETKTETKMEAPTVSAKSSISDDEFLKSIGAIR